MPLFVLLILFFFSPPGSLHAEELVGKRPFDTAPDIHTRRAPLEAREIPQGPPQPFTTVTHAADFVEMQRGRKGTGLPAAFYVPASIAIEDPVRSIITTEGVGTYDTALAVIVLIEAGRLERAREILDIYDTGVYALETGAPMSLRAYPSGMNGQAFQPLDGDHFYFFDFTTVTGDWNRWRDRWSFWNAHTGPNAWLVIALLRWVAAAEAAGISEPERRPYLTLAQRLGKAMQRLQDPATQGGVRYGPRGQYFEASRSDPYEELNTENNLSAYVAFRMLYQAAKDPSYKNSADFIQKWLAESGLRDPERGTLAMGMEWRRNRWKVQIPHATDSGGTWTISALGCEWIDYVWGPGAAYRMWRGIRHQSGRTAQFKRVSEMGSLAGLDFSDLYPEEESLISPEWSVGGLFALKELLSYYGKGSGKGQLSEAELLDLGRDSETMKQFIQKRPNSYAMGPGFGGQRAGATGFGWYCPPPQADAMASINAALYLEGRSDPLAWWRQR